MNGQQGKSEYQRKVAWLKRYQESLRTEAARVTQALTGTPGGGDGQAIPRAVERIADAESRLVSAYGTALAERSRIKDAIDTVEDPLRRDILTRRYILGQRWERIAAENNLTLRRVLQLHHKTVDGLRIE